MEDPNSNGSIKLMKWQSDISQWAGKLMVSVMNPSSLNFAHAMNMMKAELA